MTMEPYDPVILSAAKNLLLPIIKPDQNTRRPQLNVRL